MEFVFFSFGERKNGLGDEGLMGQCPQNFWARTAPENNMDRMGALLIIIHHRAASDPCRLKNEPSRQLVDINSFTISHVLYLYRYTPLSIIVAAYDFVTSAAGCCYLAMLCGVTHPTGGRVTHCIPSAGLSVCPSRARL